MSKPVTLALLDRDDSIFTTFGLATILRRGEMAKELPSIDSVEKLCSVYMPSCNCYLKLRLIVSY